MGRVTDPLRDPELAERAAAVRADWQAEEAGWTRNALTTWHHGRTLADVLRDCMHRGDTVAVHALGVVLTGELVGVGVDVARLETAGGRFDIRVGADASVAVRVVSHAEAGGTRGDAGVTTLRHRLLEHEAVGTRVEIASPLLDDLYQGSVEVGSDHVAVLSGDDDRQVRTVYVPLAHVAWVRTSAP